MKKFKPQYIDVSSEQLDSVLLQIKEQCGDECYQLIKALVDNYQYLLKAIQAKRVSIKRLLKLFFGLKTEKNKKGKKGKKDNTSGQNDDGVSEDKNKNQTTSDDTPAPSKDPTDKPKGKGHGRRSANDYPGAKRIKVQHPELKSGDPCPECETGKVYDNVEPYVILRFQGQAPIAVTVWELEKLRCNLCGEIFSAPAPEEMGKRRWDETAQAVLALNRYGSGIPFNRIAKLQANFGMPISPSTQWDAVNSGESACLPAFEELKRQAAQGTIVHNDDTTNRILEYNVQSSGAESIQSEDTVQKEEAVCAVTNKLTEENSVPTEGCNVSAKMNSVPTEDGDMSTERDNVPTDKGHESTDDSNADNFNEDALIENGDSEKQYIPSGIELSKRKGKSTNPDERKGVHTTGIISEYNGHQISLFFTGKKHAGENLDDVLKHRAKGLSPPTLMCDALSRNLPTALAIILANCLAHARRQFVYISSDFPEECRFLLDQLAVVYHNDAIAKEQKMSADERLAFHQRESKPVMDTLYQWFNEQIDECKVEPNSGLGQAITYMKKHWDALTMFLKVAGCPLDNNIVERSLKKAILQRKNSLFYKTQHGADVGDMYMSLIHTAELEGVNAFDYLTALLRNPKEVAASPGEWMPWNFQQTLQRRQIV